VKAAPTTALKGVQVSLAPTHPVTQSGDDANTAARRKLIVHFFRLGVLSRHKAAIAAKVWEESDDALVGQERWARVFERAEKAERLDALWDAVFQASDPEEAKTLMGETNPFKTLA
jgi:hypothetical protein